MRLFKVQQSVKIALQCKGTYKLKTIVLVNIVGLFIIIRFNVRLLKVQSWKLYNKKYLIASIQIANTKTFAF